MGLKRFVTSTWNGVAGVDVANIHPIFATRVEALLDDAPFRYRIRSGWRTSAQQTAIKRRAGIFGATPGFSPHQAACAVDFDIPAGDYRSKRSLWIYEHAPHYKCNFGLLPQDIARATGNHSRAVRAIESWHMEPAEFVPTRREGKLLVNYTFGRYVITERPARPRTADSITLDAKAVLLSPLQMRSATSSASLLQSRYVVLVDGHPPKGLLVPGNIDLTARPLHRNADGTISTVRSVSFDLEPALAAVVKYSAPPAGAQLLLPTISPSGAQMSNADAVKYFVRTGQHLGVFASRATVDAYAEALHDEQAVYVDEKTADSYPHVQQVVPTAPVSTFDSRSASLSNRYLTADPLVARYRAAFLDVLAHAEGTAYRPNSGYNTFLGGRQFSSLADHPPGSASSKYGRGTAAGRYQIEARTWNGLGGIKKFGNFGPEAQDAAALTLARPAWSHIDAGDILGAIRLKSTRGTWPSLPGGTQQTCTEAQVLAWWKASLAGLATKVLADAATVGGADDTLDPTEIEEVEGVNTITSKRPVELGSHGIDVAVLQSLFGLPITGTADQELMTRLGWYLDRGGHLPTELVLQVNGQGALARFGLRWAN